MKKPVRILSYPAPSREPVWSGTGWFSVPWTIPGILRTLAHGGWFSSIPGDHEFEKGAMSFAYDAQAVMNELRGV